MNDRNRAVVDWPPPRRKGPRTALWLLAGVMAAVLLGGRTTLSYYVNALWFDSLGYASVYWTTINLQAAAFLGFAAITFLVLYGSYLVFKPPRLGELTGAPGHNCARAILTDLEETVPRFPTG